MPGPDVVSERHRDLAHHTDDWPHTELCQTELCQTELCQTELCQTEDCV